MQIKRGLLALCFTLSSLSIGNSLHAAVVVFDTDSSGLTDAVDDGSNGGTAGDDIADAGDTSLTYTDTFMSNGVSYDLSFDISAIGGFLSGTSSSLGIWSNSIAETGTDQVNVDSTGTSDEGFLVDNVLISNASGGTAVFESISRVGFRFATANNDSGEFTVGGTSYAWDDLDDGDADAGLNNLDADGTTDQAFNLQAVVGAPVNSFQLLNTGNNSSAWRLDAIEFSVNATAVPEPSSLALLSILGTSVFVRRQRKRRAHFARVSSRG